MILENSHIHSQRTQPVAVTKINQLMMVTEGKAACFDIKYVTKYILFNITVGGTYSYRYASNV